MVINNNEIEEELDYIELEKSLDQKLESELADLELLEEDKKKINNPDNLGIVIEKVIWEQCINQVGAIAGEDFIKANKGLTLNLSKDAHIQMLENFEQGNIAFHNDKIDYSGKYSQWNIDKNKLSGETRDYFDKGRAMGNKTINKDHTISIKELAGRSDVQAYMSKEEQWEFANDTNVNLKDLPSEANQSKSDKAMKEWLKSERNGQTPDERFGLNKEELLERDEKARKELEKELKRGENEAIETGKQSRKDEAFRIGGQALKAVLLGLLIELIRKIIAKLIEWIKAGEKKFAIFIEYMKEAIIQFVKDLKNMIFTSVDVAVTTIATAIVGPVVNTIKKAWILIKQGAKSVKEAIEYIKSPNNAEKPIDILIMEVGKIVVAGAVAAGAILLGEVIAKGLATIPGFAVPIPALGSLSDILGMFLSAIVSGIVGALLLRAIDNIVAKRQIENIVTRQIEAGNNIAEIQGELVELSEKELERIKLQTNQLIGERHLDAHDIIENAVKQINSRIINDNKKRFARMDSMLKEIEEV